MCVHLRSTSEEKREVLIGNDVSSEAGLASVTIKEAYTQPYALTANVLAFVDSFAHSPFLSVYLYARPCMHTIAGSDFDTVEEAYSDDNDDGTGGEAFFYL